MAQDNRGRIVVLDDGSGSSLDLIGRVQGAFPQVFRLSSQAAGADSDLAVDRKQLTVKGLVRSMARERAPWGMLPRGTDPVVLIADFVSAARTLLSEQRPAFILVSAREGTRYRRIAVVLDVNAPITTGTLGLAAIGVAWRTGAALDVLVLGADPADPPDSWADFSAGMDVGEEAAYLGEALSKARDAGIAITWVPLGEGADPGQLVIDAVRVGGYDLVLDDVRPLDVGPRVGRLQRVQRQLVAGDAPDTAYRLLRDAPCDVGLVVDAVSMRLVPASAVRVGAVAALSVGLVGVAGAPGFGQASNAATMTAVAAAPSEPVAPTVDAAAQVGIAPPSVAELPAEVSDEEFAQIAGAWNEEQVTLAEQKRAAEDLMAQQAAADQQLAAAEAELARANQEVAAATDALGAAQDGYQASKDLPGRLSDGQRAQGEAAVHSAEQYLVSAQARVVEAEAAAAAAVAPAESAAAAVAAQQAVVDAEAANAAAWRAYVEAADARTAKIVAPTTNYTITATHGEAGPYWSSGRHTGLDFAAPTGTPIYAAADGVVVEAGWGGAYGNYTVVRHADGTTTHYAHQSSIGVQVGQPVAAGQQIGTLGSTGNSTGPHLHFEVRDASGGYLDPQPWLGSAI